ncbi:MAG TPA: hypothetical protein VKO18_04735 [Terriglobia bacterium]|nr:hypothetical protein [Terriglobia bacterium]
MLSVRLVQMIEDHAEELTGELIKDLRSNPRTPHYHHLTFEELHYRTYSVYRNLGHWVSQRSEEPIAASYADLAIRRYAEGVPLEEIVFALASTKNHLYSYVQSTGLMDSAVELHQERELRRLIGNFYDKAIYYTVRAYEREAALFHPRSAMKAAA